MQTENTKNDFQKQSEEVVRKSHNKKVYFAIAIVFTAIVIGLIVGIFAIVYNYGCLKNNKNTIDNQITKPVEQKNKKTTISILRVQSDYEYDIELRKLIPNENIKDRIDVVIPDYEVSHSEITGYDYDYISIPGGTVLLETDKIKVPVYKIFNTYPKDIKIQNVILVNKSVIKKERGLNLSPVLREIGKNENNKIPFIKSCHAEETENDWYPNDFFSWTTREIHDEKEELEIVIFPFHYNKKTKESIFYKNFSFKIDYIKSNVRIIRLYESKYVYRPTEPINFDFTIFNFDSAKTYYIESKLFTQSKNYTEKLDKQTIKFNQGQNDFVISLKPNYNFECAFDECKVLYTVKIVDENNLLFDLEIESFYISEK